MSAQAPPPIARSDAAPFRGRRLRLGILLDPKDTPAWVHDVIDLARAHPALDVRLSVDEALVVKNPTARTSLLLRLFNRLDQRRAAAHRSSESHPNLKNRLSGIPTSLLHDMAPDVVWQTGSSTPSDDFMAQVPYGVWRYRPGNGFREVYERSSESIVMLEAVGNTTAGVRTLGTAHVRTHPSSPAINESQMELSGRRLLLDSIERLLAHEWSPDEFFAHHPKAPSAVPGAFRPSNFEMIKFAAFVLLPSVIRTRRAAGTQWQWTIGMAPTSEADPCGHIRANEAQWMSPPDAAFVADPFVWQHDSGWFVFVEEFPFAADKGHISVASWSEDAGFGPLETALVEDFHLSYPFLFEHEGKLLMMPERHMGGDLWTYECVEFPRRWIKHRPVLEGVCCVDGTLLRHDGRWWLFYSRATGELSEDNLYSCHATTPFGPWTQHPMNPIRSGLRGSRMAGNFFTSRDGRLVRPAQDCSACYGGSLVFHEVEELTPENYREKEIAATDAGSFPAPWNQRCHTFNLADKRVVFDACRRIMRARP